MPADDRTRRDAREDRNETCVRRHAREDLRVVPRRRVAEQHVPDPVNRHAQRLRPAGELLLQCRIDLVGRMSDERPDVFGQRARVRPSQLFEHGTIAISPDELHRDVEGEQAGKGLARHRPRKHIPADHNLIDPGLSNVLQNGLERRQVAMNVVESCDAHAMYSTWVLFLEVVMLSRLCVGIICALSLTVAAFAQRGAPPPISTSVAPLRFQ